MADEMPRDMTAKRAIIYSDRATDDDRNAAADLYLEAERFGEALEFLERTRDPGRIARVEQAGLARGDTFLLLQVERLRRQELPVEAWREAARAAESRGKYHDAWRALTRAGDEEAAEALRAAHIPDYRPYRPEGK